MCIYKHTQHEFPVSSEGAYSIENLERERERFYIGGSLEPKG